MEEYDAIIVGAGPAGGSCARELSEIGRNILLLERSKVIGEPNFSTAGTPEETMEVFNLPKKITDSPWNSLLISSKNKKAEFVYKKRMGYILNYKLLKQFLSDQAKKSGAEILVGASVKDSITKNGKVTGVKYEHNGELKEASGKIIVDASGGRAVLSQKLGIVNLNKRSRLAVGVEYHMKNVNFERKERMEFYLGASYVPKGYAWIFPSGPDTAKVGLCNIVPPDGKLNLLNLLQKFSSKNSQTASAIKTDVHGGSLFANGGVRNHVVDGLIAIGDSAVQTNPLGGEGIRHGLYSGRFAANVIDSALDKNNFQANFLNEYNKLWGDYVEDKWKTSYYLQKIYSNLTLKEGLMDKFVSMLSKQDSQYVFDILFNYKFDFNLKIISRTLSLISK